MGLLHHTALSSGGEALSLACPVYRPERAAEVTRILQQHPGSLIFRGGGRSFGDAAMEEEGVVDTTRLNRFIAFDEKQGVIRLESGVRAGDIAAVILPKGWWLPALPESPMATIGGAVASNSFSCSQHHSGEIGHYVRELTLQLASGRIIRTSAELDPDMFYATLGGMGLTGFIKELTLQLVPVTSRSLDVHEQAVESAEALVRRLREASRESVYCRVWLDQSAAVEQLGRGIITQADYSDVTHGGAALDTPSPQPVTLKQAKAGRLSRWQDKRRYEQAQARPWSGQVDLTRFIFTQTDAATGKGGAIRLSCLLPEGPELHLHLHRLLHLLLEKQARMIQPEVSWHRSDPVGAHLPHPLSHPSMLRFSRDGLAISFTLPFSAASRLLMKELTRHVAHVGGRVHLAEDSVSSLDELQHMYGDRLAVWWEAVSVANPKARLSSHMGLRFSAQGGKV